MREWFIVGSKLLGIYFLYWAFTILPESIALSMSSFSKSVILNEGPSNLAIFLSSISATVVMIVFSFVLLFKTNWLADTLKVTGQSHKTEIQYDIGMLQTGISLIGIYIFCTKIGGLIQAYVESRAVSRMFSSYIATQPEGLSWSQKFAGPMATLAISLFLIFGSRYIASFLTKPKRTATEQEAPLDGE
jgi:uncharacterized membrane protein (DUF485 family)